MTQPRQRVPLEDCLRLRPRHACSRRVRWRRAGQGRVHPARRAPLGAAPIAGLGRGRRFSGGRFLRACPRRGSGAGNVQDQPRDGQAKDRPGCPQLWFQWEAVAFRLPRHRTARLQPVVAAEDGGQFASRRAWGNSVAYRSQFLTPHRRALAQGQRIRRQLGGERAVRHYSEPPYGTALVHAEEALRGAARGTRRIRGEGRQISDKPAIARAR